jgi:hypothetical protein
LKQILVHTGAATAPKGTSLWEHLSSCQEVLAGILLKRRGYGFSGIAIIAPENRAGPIPIS